MQTCKGSGETQLLCCWQRLGSLQLMMGWLPGKLFMLSRLQQLPCCFLFVVAHIATCQCGGQGCITRPLSYLNEPRYQLPLHACYHQRHHLLPGCLHARVVSTAQLTITCAASCSVLHVVGKCLEDDVSMFRYNIQDIVDDLEVRLLSDRPDSLAWRPSPPSKPSETC